MRYKVAPPPRSVSFLAAVRGAVPLVPETESDCCLAIQRATDVSGRERAREYLTFTRALRLVTENSRGYHRTLEPLETARLASAFRERVFLGRELVETVGTEPKSPEDAFDAVRDAVPRWERERQPDWEREWRDRVDRLLEWAVVLGLVERVEGGYRTG